MANEQNLIPSNKRSKAEVRENGRKGGVNSGKTRREQKTIRAIVNDLMATDVSRSQFAKIAEKLGIEGDKSVKELFTVVCVMNAMKKGNLDDLGKLREIIGEEREGNADNGILEELAAYLKQ